MTDRPVDRPPGLAEGGSGPPARPSPPDARRRFRRRSSVVAVAVVVAWLAPMAIMGAVTGYWTDENHPRGLMGAVTMIGVAAVAVVYLRISHPVGDLLGAAERVGFGDYGVDVEVRGPRELRLLTATFNEMAARLAATEQQRRRFLADITHELRNPLAVLQSEID
ncbi:MAG: HAMP domain-containing protein, partial [Acidimicrobiales bacterium]|nr:HAMP domain-containing protein [Acidimicrobiales bacterium]